MTPRPIFQTVLLEWESQQQSGIGATICQAQAQGDLGSTPAQVKKFHTSEKDDHS